MMNTISNTQIVYPMIKKMYLGTIVGAGLIGTTYGFKMGYDASNAICFQKNKLTPLEYVGEVVCFSGITISNGILCGLLSCLTATTLPLSFPMITAYKLYNMER